MNRLTNKRLVKFLMDYRGIEMISVTDKNIVVQVSKKFTPVQAEELCRKVGHTNDFKAATGAGNNYIIFPRF
ncbi:hypothetical protein [Bacteroides caecimuris]|uniref:hypothetical protein n=1 Tax=Bacteroides caecimuris TaxID=1796613 RepID=UPI00242A3381|nr:hypothetical protein [Bacteroides caecimuris]